jgi:hypothetical protein
MRVLFELLNEDGGLCAFREQRLRFATFCLAGAPAITVDHTKAHFLHNKGSRAASSNLE